MSSSVPIYAKIDVAALKHNLSEVRRLVGKDTEIMAIVKANAYGHGLVEVARVMLDNGASRLGVARAGEAIRLRKAGITAPILILGYTPPAQYEDVLTYDLTQTIYDVELARMLSDIAGKLGKKARVHLKIDTGMGRLGFLDGPSVMRDIIEVALLPNLELEGMFTHFASADIKDKSYTQQQFSRFIELACTLGRDGIDIPLLHAANSAAIIDMPETHLNLVRPGIMLYGLYPSPEVEKHRVDLKPAMTLKAQVSFVKKVPAGTSVSYGCTYTTPKETILATVPAGYGDGYSRLLSNQGEVLIHGRRAPVVGRVCMDQLVVNVGHITDVAIGDEVVLYGRQGDAVLPVEELADKIGTINYEVVTAVSARVPRVYVNGEE
ncbi:MAG: alanine racemase [Peptococcaceae bacterium]|nr:alanine racemase [Peptococcaceae bacterium]